MSRLRSIMDRLSTSAMQSRAVAAGTGAALGAILGPVASTLTGDKKSDNDTLVRDMIAGALGGAVGGLMSPGAAPLGGALGGVLSGLADLKKTSSQAGQDLRLPVMGGTKFPTDDSKSSANRLLNESKAEVGPRPSSSGPTLDQTIAVPPRPRFKMASSGDPMDPLLTDPLMLYLNKQAAKDEAKEPPPLTDLLEENGRLKGNESFMPLGKAIEELVSQAPQATSDMKKKVDSHMLGPTKELFSNTQSIRKKFEDKDHSSEEGVVNRILGL